MLRIALCIFMTQKVCPNSKATWNTATTENVIADAGYDTSLLPGIPNELNGTSRFCRTLFQIERAALHSYGPGCLFLLSALQFL